MTRKIQIQPFANLPIREIKKEAFRCGDCTGLNTQALIDGETCAKQGIQDASKACPSFRALAQPAVEALKDLDQHSMMILLGKALRNMPATQKKSLAASILEETRTNSAGYFFMQPVYIRYRGRGNANYLSNFATARIMSADADQVRVGSDDGSFCLTYMNNGEKCSTIYTTAEFNKLKEDMIAKENFVDPRISEATPSKNRSIDDIDYTAASASLDGQVTDIQSLAKANKIRKTNKTRSSITDLSISARNIEKALSDTAFTDDTEHEDLGFSDNEHEDGASIGGVELDGMHIFEV